jgi:hypothetical protein
VQAGDGGPYSVLEVSSLMGTTCLSIRTLAGLDQLKKLDACLGEANQGFNGNHEAVLH